MKKLIYVVVLSSIFAVASVYAQTNIHQGANGWQWTSDTDPMTDKLVVHFGKEDIAGDEDLMLTVEYTKDGWGWFIARVPVWEGDQQVMYRLGKDIATEETFTNKGGWLVHPGFVDIKKLVGCSQITVRVEADMTTYQFDVAGLEETIKIAGVAIE